MQAVSSSVNVTFRMDRGVKEQAESLFRGLGMNLSTAWNIFVNQALREKGMPFKPSMDIPNRETLEAMEETRRILAHPENYKGMTVDEAFRELGI